MESYEHGISYWFLLPFTLMVLQRYLLKVKFDIGVVSARKMLIASHSMWILLWLNCAFAKVLLMDNGTLWLKILLRINMSIILPATYAVGIGGKRKAAQDVVEMYDRVINVDSLYLLVFFLQRMRCSCEYPFPDDHTSGTNSIRLCLVCSGRRRSVDDDDPLNDPIDARTPDYVD